MEIRKLQLIVMHTLIATCFYILVLVLSRAQLQDGWDCNHFSGYYTVDLCYQYSASYQYLYVCNETDSITLYQYINNSCGQGGDPYEIITYNNTYQDSDDLLYTFQCDQSQA